MSLLQDSAIEENQTSFPTTAVTEPSTLAEKETEKKISGEVAKDSLVKAVTKPLGQTEIIGNNSIKSIVVKNNRTSDFDAKKDTIVMDIKLDLSKKISDSTEQKNDYDLVQEANNSAQNTKLVVEKTNVIGKQLSDLINENLETTAASYPLVDNTSYKDDTVRITMPVNNSHENIVEAFQTAIDVLRKESMINVEYSEDIQSTIEAAVDFAKHNARGTSQNASMTR